MAEGRKRRTYYFSVKPEGFSGATCSFILLEQFQPAVRLNVRLSVKFHVELLVKKVPLQHVFSDCF